jgi:DNA-binding MarR family transcriptional regulator
MKTLDLCLELSRAYATLSRRFDGRLGSLHGLSFSDYAMLRQLRDAPEGRLRRVDLAGKLGLTPSAVTRALIPLEKVGVVKREPDKNDARIGYAALTRAGERLLDEATETAGEVSEETVSVSATQAAALADLFAKLN